MFSKKNVKLFLQKITFSVDGEDKEDVIATALVYITPITKDLTDSIEADEDISTALFNRNGKAWAHLNSIAFKTEPEAAALEYILHEEVKGGRGMIPHVEFSKLHAMKLFPDNPDWTLAFNMSFACNDHELTWNFINRLKKTFLAASFAKVQMDLFPKTLPACCADVLVKEGGKETRTCGISPKFQVKGKDEYYCLDHARAAGPDVEVLQLPREEISRLAKLHADKELEAGTPKKGKKKGAGK